MFLKPITNTDKIESKLELNASLQHIRREELLYIFGILFVWNCHHKNLLWKILILYNIWYKWYVQQFCPHSMIYTYIKIIQFLETYQFLWTHETGQSQHICKMILFNWQNKNLTVSLVYLILFHLLHLGLKHQQYLLLILLKNQISSHFLCSACYNKSYFFNLKLNFPI